MKIISRIEKPSDEWANEDMPEWFYIAHDDDARDYTTEGVYFDTFAEAKNYILNCKTMLDAASLGRKGGSSRSSVKRAASAENGRKGGRPTNLEREERRIFYDELAERAKNEPVDRSPVHLESLRAPMREALSGHKVERCVQRYLAPVDESRAARGLETGLERRTREWWEIDGKKCEVNPPLDFLRDFLAKL